MATITSLILSGSVSGKGIKVTGTNTAGGVTIHTAHATALDYPVIQVVNTGTTSRLLTLEWGGVTDVDNTIEVTIPAQGSAGSDGLITVVDGTIPITGGLLVKAFAAGANELVIYGSVNRIA